MDRKLGHGPHVKWLWARGLGPDQTDVKYRETSAHTESFGGQKTNLRKIIGYTYIFLKVTLLNAGMPSKFEL